jgi:hypothetical protein
MMFMIPLMPHQQRDPGDPPRKMVKHRSPWWQWSGIRLGEYREIIQPNGSAMALTQDLLISSVASGTASAGCLHIRHIHLV